MCIAELIVAFSTQLGHTSVVKCWQILILVEQTPFSNYQKVGSLGAFFSYLTFMLKGKACIEYKTMTVIF